MKNYFKRNGALLIFVFPALLFLSISKLFPAISGFYYSLTNWNGLSKTYDFVGFDNFIHLFSDEAFLSSIKFTFKYVFFHTILVNIVALAFALMIENLKKGKGFFRTVLYMPNMISLIIGGLMWKFIFTQVTYNLVDNLGMSFLDQSWTGDPKYSFIAIIIVSIWGGAGYLMIIYISALQSVPTALYESADIDGASRFDRLKNITIPMIRNGFTICFFVTLNSAFQVFDVVFSLTGGGPGRKTQVVALNIYEEAFTRNKLFGYATAKSIVLFLIILIFTLIQLKITRRNEGEA